jgi:phosphomannomutase
MMNFDPTILRKYDVRGLFPEEINPDIAYKLGQLFTACLPEEQPSVVVGGDGRLSTPALLEALIQGCVQQGGNVYNIGLIPSPVLYYGAHLLQTTAGIMVTGSHNSAMYNGFKLLYNRQPFYGEQIKSLQQTQLPDMPLGLGAVWERDIRQEYIRALLKDFPLRFTKRLKIVWDPGHGAVAAVLPDLLKYIDGDHIVINNTVNGHFPSHHPDPMLPGTMQQLRRLVLQQQADIGFGFDGDGDRLGVIDHQGTQWNNDILLGFYAKYLLKERPSSTILMDIKSSQSIFEAIRRWGGQPQFIPTGHAILKTKMLEQKALLGGELSGHFVFTDHYYGYDDALYAALRFIKILLASPDLPALCLGQFLQSFPFMFSTPAIRIPCESAQALDLIRAVKEHLIQKNRQFIAIDGLRVQTPKGWWLLRQSHTEEGLVVRCEAFTREGLIQLKEEAKAYFIKNNFEKYWKEE